jgi:predicted RNA binding protein YcfA (HicA-like mRNA interferase family)
MKVREAIKMIEKHGWEMLPRTGTNHRQFKHPAKPGRVTISGNEGREISPRDLASILKQAGLK